MSIKRKKSGVRKSRRFLTPPWCPQLSQPDLYHVGYWLGPSCGLFTFPDSGQTRPSSVHSRHCSYSRRRQVASHLREAEWHGRVTVPA